MPTCRLDWKPYGCSGAPPTYDRGVSALCGLVGSLGSAAAMVDSPGEVLSYVADLQDGKADEGGTRSFIDGISSLVDQGRRFLDSVGR